MLYEFDVFSGAEEFAIYPCPSGYYCPELTTRSDEFPCPVGTYYNTTGARNTTDCLPCNLGSYCDVTGLSFPAGLCDPGKIIAKF